MNCREFRRKHDAYVDDTLSGVDLDAMERHRRLCPSCAQLDTRVRRALLVAHNLPTIEPSAAFAERLQARLAEERTIRLTTGAARSTLPHGVWRPLSGGAYTVLAAGIFAVAAAAATLTVLGHGHQAIRLDPVVAMLPEAEPSTLATSAMVASMPAGMAVWPAVFVAQQAPWHFASDAVATEGR
jgi:hypothetical protein